MAYATFHEKAFLGSVSVSAVYRKDKGELLQ
jgi:hypothetical protein